MRPINEVFLLLLGGLIFNKFKDSSEAFSHLKPRHICMHGFGRGYPRILNGARFGFPLLFSDSLEGYINGRLGRHFMDITRFFFYFTNRQKYSIPNAGKVAAAAPGSSSFSYSTVSCNQMQFCNRKEILRILQDNDIQGQPKATFHNRNREQSLSLWQALD